MGKLKGKKLFLLDMDGTLYIDDCLFQGSKEFLDTLKKRKHQYFFMTNNSSKGINSYIEKISSFGIPCGREEFLTSVDGTIMFLKNKYGEALERTNFYVMGTQSLKTQLRDANIKVVDFEEKTINLDGLGEQIDGLLLGFDRELTYKKLEVASYLLTLKDRERRDKVAYYATNPDWVCPASFGYVPDCGAMAEMLFHSTGRRPLFIGKPETIMVEMALEKTGISKEETVLIGDRLYTDILCGNRAGIDTVFVLSGEGKREDLEKGEWNPTYVMEDISQVLKEIEE